MSLEINPALLPDGYDFANFGFDKPTFERVPATPEQTPCDFCVYPAVHGFKGPPEHGEIISYYCSDALHKGKAFNRVQGDDIDLIQVEHPRS